MSYVSFNHHRFHFTEIQQRNYAEATPDHQSVLDFCADWLNGKKEFILFTSGSTGKPKEIIVSRNQMKISAALTAEALELKEGDHALVCLNAEYIAGKMMLVRGLETAMNMTIIAPSSNPLISFHEKEKFDFTAMVPLQLQTILRETPERIPQLNRFKAILLGGASIHKKLEEEIQKVIAPVYSTFGMTETVSHIALRRINGKNRSDYYQALSGVILRQDERGCLIIKSPTTDYKEVITNDVVELKDQDQFLWLGRVDHVINSGGIKIQAEKIESVVDEIFNTLKIDRRFFVSGMPHQELGEAVTLFIEGEMLNEELALKNILQDKLSKYELPKTIQYVKKFSETATGKIDPVTIKKASYI